MFYGLAWRVCRHALCPSLGQALVFSAGLYLTHRTEGPRWERQGNIHASTLSTFPMWNSHPHWELSREVRMSLPPCCCYPWAGDYCCSHRERETEQVEVNVDGQKGLPKQLAPNLLHLNWNALPFGCSCDVRVHGMRGSGWWLCCRGQGGTATLF